MSDETSVELDPYMVEALAQYREASTLLEAETERRAKAREALLAFLQMHGAEVGTVAGTPVVSRTEYDYEALDVPALKAAEPSTYRRYAVLRHQTRIRVAS